MSLLLVRFGLPAAIATAGIVLVVVGSDAGRGAGIVLIGVAALVMLANLFMRLAFLSQRERAREESAAAATPDGRRGAGRVPAPPEPLVRAWAAVRPPARRTGRRARRLRGRP